MASKRARLLAGADSKLQPKTKAKAHKVEHINHLMLPPLPLLSQDSKENKVAVSISSTRLCQLSRPYITLLQRWLALDATLAFRRRPKPFSDVKLAVETYSGHRFDLYHLGQFLTLWPGCYIPRKGFNKHDDHNLHNSLSQYSSQNYLLYIELSNGEQHANKNPPPPSSSSSCETIQRILPSNGGILLESTLLSRQETIEKIVTDLFISQKDVHNDDDEVLNIKSVDILGMIREESKSHEEAEDSFSSSLSSSSSSTVLEEKQNAPPVSSSSSSPCSSVIEEKENSLEASSSRLEVLRQRVINKEKSDVIADKESGGREGRRRSRLISLLPNFCDCLHSYLIQRRTHCLPKHELIFDVSKRFPAMIPLSEVNELLKILLELEAKWYQVVIAPPDFDSVKPIEMLRFDTGLKYSTIRQLAVKMTVCQ